MVLRKVKAARSAPGADRAMEADRMAELPVELLVDRCLANSPGAWEEFLRRYANLIYSTLIRKVSLDPADQEDAFQNAVVAIYESLPKLKDPSLIVSWIVQITYRQGINRIRRRARRRESALDDFTEAQIHAERASEDAGDAPVDEVRIELERAQRAREMLEAAPERCRRLLRLLFYADPPLAYQEIARREGIPIGSIGPTRARCLEKLRALCESLGWVS